MTDNETLKRILDDTTQIANALNQNGYKVLNSQDLSDLENKVNDAMGDDWQCVGGIAVAVSGDTVEYFQSMILRVG